MRLQIGLPTGYDFRAIPLHGTAEFLYRRMADQGREVLGVGVLESADSPRFDARGTATDWWFGYLSYGCKDHFEGLSSRHDDVFRWPLSYWFRPKWVVEWSKGDAHLHVHEERREEAMAWVERMRAPVSAPLGSPPIEWSCGITRNEYLAEARDLLQHIQQGDIYEVNYCLEHHAQASDFDPYATFDALLTRTRAPQAGFIRLGGRFALCCSPERFLRFDGNRMIGEPMKGTSPRGRDPLEDDRRARGLITDPKERSENVMAVDVMRNDLSRTSVPGTVRVTELLGLRTHPRVHQLVSVIEAVRRPDASPFDTVRAAFPMASMTGAPKVSAMRLIDAHEHQARGLYSGSMGFFAPDGTGDLNVVIRTVLFDSASGRLSIPTGSALTALCDPAAEWEECMVKFNSIAHALTAS